MDAIAQREEEERGNAMKALENRTLDSKREMDILSALDEMKSLKVGFLVGGCGWSGGGYSVCPGDGYSLALGEMKSLKVGS